MRIVRREYVEVVREAWIDSEDVAKEINAWLHNDRYHAVDPAQTIPEITAEMIEKYFVNKYMPDDDFPNMKLTNDRWDDLTFDLYNEISNLYGEIMWDLDYTDIDYGDSDYDDRLESHYGN